MHGTKKEDRNIRKEITAVALPHGEKQRDPDQGQPGKEKAVASIAQQTGEQAAEQEKEMIRPGEKKADGMPISLHGEKAFARRVSMDRIAGDVIVTA